MNDNFLTGQGRERRSRILELAVGEARRRRRRRWTVPVGATVICLIVAGLALLRPAASPRVYHGPRGLVVRAVSKLAMQRDIAIEYVATDPTITDRLSIKPEPPRWTNIGDDELLKELAAAGQPAGLAYVNGHARLLLAGK